MGKLFGTDGIRGIANRDPITTEIALKLGRAAIRFCERKGLRPTIVIGRDTRESGEMLEHSLVSGVLSAGGEAFRIGEIPTPGVAFLTKELGGGAGIVISASHNPHEYNGFKVFSHEGFKLSNDEETEIEDLILSEVTHPPNKDSGKAGFIGDAWKRYVYFLKKTLPGNRPLRNMKIVIDCANGATWKAGPALFKDLGARIETLFADPDGENINLNCGSQYTETLRKKVLETGFDLGLAFDGDGDRLIAVDEKGQVLTGDQVLIICAKMLKDKGLLKNKLVVSTVMSNMGLQFALNNLGIEHSSSPVGDRYVMEKMRAKGAVLGGEDSGHIIFLDHHTTGDGLISALQLLTAIKFFEQPLSGLATLMTIFPQTLINVPVKIKPDISSVPELGSVIKNVEQKMGKRGRVLVRYSGTETVLRVMVEGEKEEDVERFAGNIAEVVRRNLG
ncbi:MAG: phosphoglucosamine mutase [Deltaproteobacteria bacterium]|nr:phosphoglucosamine mutase [Deltaproteobacteria bacterium]MBW2344645.1 phosphoglucosamine mutase [Deltaproteobacteria bacterium]